MHLKLLLICVTLVLTAVESQNNRVRRQGVKGYGPRPQGSRVGAGGRTRPKSPSGGYRPQPQRQEDEGQVNSAEGEANPEPPVYGGVQGTPGVDFPAFRQIPKTSFTCTNVPYEPGMYADQETQCQVYHVCFQGRKESFLCGVGTVFNQAILACDYWHSVDCAAAPSYYSVNEELGKAGAEPGPGGFQPQQPQRRPGGRRPAPQPTYPGQQPERVQQPYQPQPQSRVRPNINQRPPRPQPPRKQPGQQPYQPQEPQPYEPQPSPQQPYQPQPQQPYQPQRPVAPPRQRPYAPAPQSGKPVPPRPSRYPPPPPPQPPIVQMKDEGYDYGQQRQQQSYDYY